MPPPSSVAAVLVHPPARAVAPSRRARPRMEPDRPPRHAEVTVSFDAHQMDVVLLVGAVVMLVAILAVRLSVGVGLPSLLVYLLMGVLLGEAGLGIEFEDANVAHALGFAALVLILAEGGLTTQLDRDPTGDAASGSRWRRRRRRSASAVVAVGPHYLFGLDWQLAVLLGAVTSPTDAAAVFSVLRRVPLPRRLTGALEAESGPQRRADGPAGDAGQRRRRRSSTGCSASPGSWPTSSCRRRPRSASRSASAAPG